jgi:hypothetical protein
MRTQAFRSSMRLLLAIGAFALGGCGTVNEPLDDGADAATGDAATSAGPSLALAEVPARIAVGEAVELAFTISDAAGASVAWSMVAGGGSFQPASGTVTLNPAGVARITTQFTAPTVGGDSTHTLMLSGRKVTTAMVTTRVRSLVPYGEHVAFADNGGQTISPNYLFGQSVQIPQDCFLMKLGVISTGGGYNARLALYRDAAGAPTELVAGMTTAEGVGNGAVTFAIPPTAIAAGTYWILINPSSAAPVNQSTSVNSPHAAVPLATTAPLPASLTAVQSLPARKNNLYVLIASY